MLVLACSQRKSRVDAPLPAIERYDGPAFRVLRKYLRSTKDPSLKVLILSAKFGLIRAGEPIVDYNQRLDARRASFLRARVTDRLAEERARLRPDSTLLCMSKLYLTCVGDPEGMEIASPGLGRKLAHLKAWLYNR